MGTTVRTYHYNLNTRYKTITKLTQKKIYKVTDQELDTLPREAQDNPHCVWRPMLLYVKSDVYALASTTYWTKV